MFKQICLGSMLFFVSSATAQINRPPAYPEAEVQMQVPPPVSSMGFPTVVGEGELANYLRVGIRFSGGYVNNLYPGIGSGTLDDSTFSLEPNISVDRTTDRIHEVLEYTPSFDFYNPDDSLNTINHAGAVRFQYRFTPFVTFLIGDTVTKTSNTWNQPLSSGSVSGGLPPAAPGFVAPFAPQISNSAFAQLAWQFAENSMIGLGGNTTLLDYTDSSQAQGLFNSNSRGGSAFYAHRLGARQYVGGLYQYSLIIATPVTTSTLAEADLDANNFLGFYTFYLQPRISISLGAGSQYYDLTQAPAASSHAWAPIAIGSIGWQVARANFALNYSHLVTEGQGVIGAYTSDSGNLAMQLQLSPNWIANVSGSYAQLVPAAESFVNSTPGGHTLSFAGMLQRRLGANLTLSAQYEYLHQNYADIPSITNNPDSSRATASITYHFSRLLGR
jgi:hypothetical protein